LKVVDPVEVDRRAHCDLLVQPLAEQWMLEPRTQHDVRVEKSVRREHHDVPGRFILLPVRFVGDAGGTPGRRFHGVHGRPEQQRDAWIQVQRRHLVEHRELRVDRAQVAHTARAACRPVLGRNACPRAGLLEIECRIRLLQEAIGVREPVRRLRVRTAPRARSSVRRTGNRHDLLGPRVERLEVVVAERPVEPDAVGRAQAEVVRQHARRHRPPAVRSPAEARCVDPRFLRIAVDERVPESRARIEPMRDLPVVRVALAALEHEDARVRGRAV
jgi:hypothetical protein